MESETQRPRGGGHVNIKVETENMKLQEKGACGDPQNCNQLRQNCRWPGNPTCGYHVKSGLAEHFALSFVEYDINSV